MKKLTPRDKYLQKKYGITEEEYDEQLEKQGGGCAICGSTPKARPLHVDHNHKIENWKIISVKLSKGVWRAFPEPLGITCIASRLSFSEQAETKPLARAKVKARLKRISCRGILCWPCNRGLQVFADNEKKIYGAGIYLSHYNNNIKFARNEGKGFDLDDRPGDNEDVATESRKVNHNRLISGSVSVPK